MNCTMTDFVITFALPALRFKGIHQRFQMLSLGRLCKPLQLQCPAQHGADEKQISHCQKNIHYGNSFGGN